jgi:hypothetical protein
MSVSVQTLVFHLILKISVTGKILKVFELHGAMVIEDRQYFALKASADRSVRFDVKLRALCPPTEISADRPPNENLKLVP